MGFVDDDGVILAQGAVALKCVEQNAIGHHLDLGFGTHFVGETNLITNQPAELNL